MAVVAKKTNLWVNADGLVVQFGPGEGVSTTSGEYRTPGPRHEIEVVVNLPTLPTVSSANTQIQSETVIFPAGAMIEEVELLVQKETTGTSGTLDLGLVRMDRTTEIDFDGFLAAAAIAAGTEVGNLTRYVKGTATGGALIGARTTFPGYIVAQAKTTDFTAGVVKARIFYSFPLTTEV